MENLEIARVLMDYADLLEISGGNFFQVRSYRDAARTLSDLSRPITQILESKEELTKLPGIGRGMADHIREIVETGSFSKLEKIQKKFPRSLAQLVKLEGLGPKKVRKLFDELGVSSVAKLEEALATGSVEKLPGFGKTSAQKIQRALKELAFRPSRFKLSDADQLVRPLLGYLRKAPGLAELEVAGSYRRRRETVGDIDILAICEKPEPLMERFRTYPDVERVEMAGETRSSLILRSGLKVDLRVLPQKAYGAALHYFTGSKPHNVAVRKLGVERGLRISEYGVFHVPKGMRAEDLDKEDGERLGGEKEEDVFSAVGMVWVPPELREDRGEVKAAKEDALPSLVTLGDIRGDLHVHSTWTDGRSTIEEMAKAGKKLGYKYLAIADHSQSTRIAGGLDPQGFESQWEEIEKIRKKVKGVVLLKGAEVDILPDGSLDLPDEILERFDIVVAAVHMKMGLSETVMTERVLKALSHPAVDILAHPTGRLINEREPIKLDLEKIFARAKKHDVALELNAQPDRLDLNDIQVHRAREVGVKVVINTDAHHTGQLAFMQYGIDQARRGWLEKSDVVNTWSWTKLQKWLKRCR
jgi:DNA polymerase (family 10)